MTTADLAVRNGAAEIMERVLLVGDLAKLTPQERVSYYRQVCDSLGLNPLSQPFAYIVLNGKLTLYALRTCTDQLRATRNVSIAIVARDRLDDVYVVTARATTPDGRTDESTGVVSLGGLRGDALANALMKAETKAKRRVTLSICGLGWIDESEADSVPGAERVRVGQDGEIQPPVAHLQAGSRTHEDVFPDDDMPQPTRQVKVRDRLAQGYAELVEEAARLDVPFETIPYPVPESLVIEKGKALRGAIEAKKAALVNPVTVAELDALAF